ncbi:uncharacterized protein LMH87_008597 [Akanthomyces muscarius]|uniref:Uncharacterized protein n=1 Tax=Akanthomyces muscarius TaxID=2231603 RepID=A0A9W8QJI7_AKAMU|nr:uncharacterized protein LMH87_008597 [Akanthomyces muscarius]KAJ4158050.1 hypothetical protein LMH87_008597 [Akanthomyces muscarius]
MQSRALEKPARANYDQLLGAMPDAGVAQETVRATTGAPVALPSHSLMPRAPDFPTWANRSYAGPLTTISTPSSTCTEIQAVATWTGSADPWTVILSYAGYWKGATDGRKDNCLSTRFDEVNRDGVLPVFSPGPGCPLGYGSVCAIVAPGAAITAGSAVQVYARRQDRRGMLPNGLNLRQF